MGVPAFPVSGSFGRSRTPKGWAAGAFDRVWQVILQRGHALWMLPLLLLIPLKDTRPATGSALYDHAHHLFLRGDLIRTQQEAEHGYRRFLNSDPEQAGHFQLLLARTLISRGMNQDAVKILTTGPSIIAGQEAAIESLTLQGVANTYLARFDIADRKLSEAVSLCQPAIWTACGDVPLAR